VDANSGEVLFVESKIYHVDTPSVSKTYYRGNQPVTVDSYNGQYRLKDNERNIRVFNAEGVYTMNPYTLEPVGAEDYTNSSANFISEDTKAPIEILWGLAKTHDYYVDVHQRNSYDGNGSIIKGYYNFTDEIMNALQGVGEGGNANAFALDLNNPYMVYGTGYPGFMGPVVGLDVAGHEYSHLVISRNGNGGLDYIGESGA